MTVQIERRELGNLLMEGIPEIPKQLSKKINQYLQSRSASVLTWTPNGQALLVLTRFGETAQVHAVQTPGGLRRQLTFFSDPVNTGFVNNNPKNPGLILEKDHAGNEYYQLFWFDLQSGHYENLTDNQAKNNTCSWNNQGDQFAYASTRRNNIDYDIYLRRIGEADQLLFSEHGRWYPLSWSPDDRWLLLGKYFSINESHLYMYDTHSGALKEIREAPEELISYRGGIWSTDGRRIYCCSDFGSEFLQLKYFEVAESRFYHLGEDLPWDVSELALSPDGNSLAFTVNENGVNQLYLLNTETQVRRKIDHLPFGQITNLSWSPNSLDLAMTIDTSLQPPDAFVLNVPTGKLVQWTFSEPGSINLQRFIQPNLIRFPSFDQLDIPAFYYRPPVENGRKIPVLIYIHGGPESQFRPGFFPTFQYYLNELGIAVIAPNVRGSLGYGKNFVKLDNGYKREDSVQDIGCLLDWIETQSDLDPQRVAVIGGSYGGYMVLASMTHFNHRLKCGIDMVGISNFVTFLENTKSYRRDLRRVEYGDERDPNMRKHLHLISPTSNAHKISKPMLIVQGLNDPRVPASEAEQMVQAIRKNGGEAWYLLAKDEGHGFRKKVNRDYYTKTVILFLQKYLLDSGD